jgi:hypothetical protein
MEAFKAQPRATKGQRCEMQDSDLLAQWSLRVVETTCRFQILVSLLAHVPFEQRQIITEANISPDIDELDTGK